MQAGCVKLDADRFVAIAVGSLTVIVYKTQVWYQKMPGDTSKEVAGVLILSK